MATDSAPPARRQFWQLPMFVLGLVAAGAAWKYFPPQPVNAGERVAQDLHSLRHALDRKTIDPREVEALMGRLASAPELVGDDPLTRHLLGSAHVVLAEKGSVEGAAAEWRTANAEFSKCDPNVMKENKSEFPKFIFRSAKAAAAVGVGDPAALLAGLETVPPSDEPGERSRLIADTCLRATPPDLKRAKQELTAYLSGAARGTPAAVARYKIRLSELCATSGEADKARGWLKEVGSSAPPELQADAKLVLARMAAADRDLTEAVSLLQAAEALPGLPADQRALIRYETGRGLLGLGKTPTAREYLTKAAGDDGPAAVAARVRLAEIIAREPSPKEAVTHLEAVVQGVKGEFKNPHVTTAEVRTAFESAITACRASGDYDAGVKAAVAYQAVAQGGRDRELWAETVASWGEALLAAKQSAEGKGKLTEAATEFVRLADDRNAPAERVALLNRAMTCYRSASDAAGLNAVLSKLAQVPGATPDVAANANLVRAEQHLADGKFSDGIALLNEAMKAGGPVGTRAKVKLAVAHVAEGRRLLGTPGTAAEGKKMIEFGQDLLSSVANKTYDTADERLAHQEALYNLGRLQLNPGLPALLNYPDAETRFRRLLREYPSGTYTEEASLFLGICLTQLSQGAHKNGVPPPDAERKLTEARDLYEGLMQAKSDSVRTHAELRLVNVMLLLKQWDALGPTCDKLADKYRGQVQELVVLNILYAGYTQAKRPDQAKAVFERMQKAFAALPDTAFNAEMSEYTKAHWVRWFDQMRR